LPTKLGAHPTWVGHQFYADILAFIFIAIENNSTQASHNGSPLVHPEEPFRFPTVGSAALDVCSHHQDILSPSPGSPTWLKPSRVELGWRLVDHNGKVGWEYDLLRHGNGSIDGSSSATTMGQRRRHPGSGLRNSRSHSNVQLGRNGKGGHRGTASRLPPIPHSESNSNTTIEMPVLPEKISSQERPAIISFPLNFKVSAPGLVVDYLRSFENYGAAVVWVATKDSSLEVSAQKALHASHINKKFFDVCRAKSAKSRDSNAVDACLQALTGTWVDPSVLDGHWQDKSSQVSVAAISSGMRTEQEVTTKLPWSILDISVPLISGLEETRSKSGGIIEAEVHIMMTPWSNAANTGCTRFKISGLTSC